MAAPPTIGIARDSSNDPAVGVHAKVVGANNGILQTGPNLGCSNVQVNVVYPTRPQSASSTSNPIHRC